MSVQRVDWVLWGFGRRSPRAPRDLAERRICASVVCSSTCQFDVTQRCPFSLSPSLSSSLPSIVSGSLWKLPPYHSKSRLSSLYFYLGSFNFTDLTSERKVFYNGSNGVPIMAPWKRIQLETMRLWVRSLASLSVSRIQRCCELWCRSQMRLDPAALLWLWCRPAAAALILPLAWEPPCAAGVAL